MHRSMILAKVVNNKSYPVAVATHSTAFLLSLACYLNSLSGELVHDDIFAVRDNQDLRSSTPITQLLRDDFWGEPMSSPTSHKSYRPLTVITFRINYALHELQPWGYHVINVPLHRLAMILFGVVCASRGGGWSSGEGLVFTAMILLASHPVHTEAVSENITSELEKISQLFSLILYPNLECLCTNTNLKLLLFVLLILGDWYRRQSGSVVLCLLSPLSPSLPLQCNCT